MWDFVSTINQNPPQFLTNSPLQGLKPFYELFLERKVQEVTSQAFSAATGIPRENVENAMGYARQDSNSSVTKRKAHNGKVKGL
jgi:hypothetical protein